MNKERQRVYEDEINYYLERIREKIKNEHTIFYLYSYKLTFIDNPFLDFLLEKLDVFYPNLKFWYNYDKELDTYYIAWRRKNEDYRTW